MRHINRAMPYWGSMLPKFCNDFVPRGSGVWWSDECVAGKKDLIKGAASERHDKLSKSSFEVDATINFARPLVKKIYHSNKGTYVKNLAVPEKIDCRVWKNQANLLFFPTNNFLETEAEQQIDQKDNFMRTIACNNQSTRKQITFERRKINNW